jgi:thiol-disulfide isomerase/thioredoxin
MRVSHALFCVAVLLGLLTIWRGAGECSVLASESPGAAPLAAGASFPNISLNGDKELALLVGKGLAPEGKQSLPMSELKAEAVIAFVFSMYCPHCQREAPLLNELQSIVDAKGLGSRVAVIGLGAGNSALEVDVFRKKYGLALALFPDPDFMIHKAVGQVGTPYHYLLKRDPAGGFRVVAGLLGCIESMSAFMDDALKQLGVEAKP